MSDITALVLSLGEPSLERALLSLRQQSYLPAETVMIENLVPFHKAFNRGLSRVATKYFVQVDADMVLDPDCLERLLAEMEFDPGCACVVGALRDPLIGRRIGVKLFRTEAVKAVVMHDHIAPESEWLARVLSAGWIVKKAGFLGSHEPDYTPEYTYYKYRLEGSRYRSRQAWGGLREHTQALLASQHPVRLQALLGLAEGLCRPLVGDQLKPLRAVQAVPSFSSPDHDSRAAWNWELWLKGITPASAYALGMQLGRSGQAVCRLDDWSQSRHPHAWAACLGLLAAWQGDSMGWCLPINGLEQHFLRPVLGRLKRHPRAAGLRALKDGFGPAKAKAGLHFYRAVRSFAGRLARPLPSSQLERTPLQQRQSAQIGYYLWEYPSLTETFIRREIGELKRRTPLMVLADRVEEHSLLDPSARAEVSATIYLDLSQASAHLRRYFLRSPWLFVRLALFVVASPYREFKSWSHDWQVLQRAACLADLAEQYQISLLHSPWGNPSALVCQIAARLAGKASSLQIRASELHRIRDQVFIPSLVSGAQAVITNTNYNASLLRRICGSLPLLKVVSNGLDLENFPSAQRQHREDPKPFRILAIGRLIECKGLHLLLDACAILAERGIDFGCSIVGGSSPDSMNYYVSLRRKWRKLDLVGRVNFLGALALSEIIELYAASDVFVFPAIIGSDGRRDIIPNVVLEALAMQLPIVTTPTGGIPEMVQDGISALVVAPSEMVNDETIAKALAQRLEALLLDRPLRERLGAAARDRVESKYRVEFQAEALLNIFNEVQAP